jgi:hypothetical protein
MAGADAIKNVENLRNSTFGGYAASDDEAA